MQPSQGMETPCLLFANLNPPIKLCACFKKDKELLSASVHIFQLPKGIECLCAVCSVSCADANYFKFRVGSCYSQFIGIIDPFPGVQREILHAKLI